MSKTRKEKPYKGTKRDQYTIVLEDIKSDFRAFGDGLQTLNQKFDILDHKVEVMGSDIYVMKNILSMVEKKTNRIETILQGNQDKFDDHEDRITALENNS